MTVLELRFLCKFLKWNLSWQEKLIPSKFTLKFLKFTLFQIVLWTVKWMHFVLICPVSVCDLIYDLIYLYVAMLFTAWIKLNVILQCTNIFRRLLKLQLFCLIFLHTCTVSCVLCTLHTRTLHTTMKYTLSSLIHKISSRGEKASSQSMT
jgi:hypothetical protein